MKLAWIGALAAALWMTAGAWSAGRAWGQALPLPAAGSAPLAQAAAPGAAPARTMPGTAPSAATAPADAAAAGEEITLQQAIKTALENNRNLSIAQRRVIIAKDRVREANALDYPQLNASATSSTRDTTPASIAVFFGQRLVVPQGDATTALSSVNLSQNLLDFGRSSSVQKSARIGLDVAQLNSERATQDLTLAVSQAYYLVLQSERIQEVLEDSIAAVLLQVRDARAFLAQGLVANTDVLSAEVRLAQRQQELIQARANLQLARASLNRLLGYDVNRPMRLHDVVSLTQWQGNYDTLLSAAQQNRADLKALQLAVQSSEADLRATRADYFPRINAFAEYDYNSTTFLLHNDWTSYGLSLSLNLFNGGATTAQVERRQKELLEAQDQYLERKDNISLEVKQAFLTAQQTLDQVAVAGKNVNLSRENLRIQRDRYTQGLVATTEVLLAEDDASRARSSYFQTLYAYYTALARLDNVIGKAQESAPQR